MPRYTQTAPLISNSPSEAQPQYFANRVKRSTLATMTRCRLSACLCAAPKITKLSSGTPITDFQIIGTTKTAVTTPQVILAASLQHSSRAASIANTRARLVSQLEQPMK
jgi:hypothetical protein